MEIKIIADNYVDSTGLLAEHGFSCLITAKGKTILFDTGQGDGFINNIRRMNITYADCIVLSHGHYDHTGGLSKHLAECASISGDIYASKYIFENHLKLDNGKTEYDFIGFGGTRGDIERRFRLHLNKEITEIYPDIFLSGVIERSIEFDADGKLFAEVDGITAKDRFRDEQFLIIREDEGIHIVTGCTHCGPENLINFAKKLFPDKKILSLTGGLHLFRSDGSYTQKVINVLRCEDIKIIATGHCTGLDASFAIKAALGEKVLFTKAGMKIVY
ncbi:MBL fold metallo-hydrolase [Seleniivibrio woodruffii]|uniref:MBL fold metallo-hydrolase n=1 Tax=Seleniivibrio woodruffii TaxID=1078050 RepID=UPI0026EE71DF|nr:MBL fold metallo-hydrolase [Seleniivibrio woodruffii]